MANVLVYKKWPWLVSQSGFKSIENNNGSKYIYALSLPTPAACFGY